MTTGRRRIGEIFVDLGFVTPDDLDEALEEQGRTGTRIGEILVAQGKMSRFDLASALTEHWKANVAADEAGVGAGEDEEAPAPAGDPRVAELLAQVTATALRLDALDSAAGVRDARTGARLQDLEELVERLRGEMQAAVDAARTVGPSGGDELAVRVTAIEAALEAGREADAEAARTTEADAVAARAAIDERLEALDAAGRAREERQDAAVLELGQAVERRLAELADEARRRSDDDASGVGELRRMVAESLAAREPDAAALARVESTTTAALPSLVARVESLEAALGRSEERREALERELEERAEAQSRDGATALESMQREIERMGHELRRLEAPAQPPVAEAAISAALAPLLARVESLEAAAGRSEERREALAREVEQIEERRGGLSNDLEAALGSLRHELALGAEELHRRLDQLTEARVEESPCSPGPAPATVIDEADIAAPKPKKLRKGKKKR